MFGRGERGTRLCNPSPVLVDQNASGLEKYQTTKACMNVLYMNNKQALLVLVGFWFSHVSVIWMWNELIGSTK